MRMVSPELLLPQRPDSAHRPSTDCGVGPRDAGLPRAGQPLSPHPRCSGQPEARPKRLSAGAGPWNPSPCNSPVGQFPGRALPGAGLPIPASGPARRAPVTSVYEPPNPCTLRSPPVSSWLRCNALAPEVRRHLRPAVPPLWCLPAGREPGQRLPGAAQAVGFGGLSGWGCGQRADLAGEAGRSRGVCFAGRHQPGIGPAASPACLVVGLRSTSHQTLPAGPLSGSWSPTTQGHVRDQRALSFGLGMKWWGRLSGVLADSCQPDPALQASSRRGPQRRWPLWGLGNEGA